MILLREAQDRDLPTLERWGNTPGFINLAGDRDALKDKLDRSRKSFASKKIDLPNSKYIFMAEDLKTGQVLGTSLVAGQHGTPASPHFYFMFGNEQRFAPSIGTGFIHGTLELKFDTDGPSEIGGLIIDQEARNTSERIGRQISFVRFFFMGLNQERFKSRVIAELLPPLNKRGQSPLWEAIGRRFTNMDYWEADQLCQKDKEFIFSLFPSGKIYTTFLSAEARNAIGKVGKDTEPVVHMLKKIGFEYRNEVDPFDGGPHFWADLKALKPVQGIRKVVMGDVLSGAAESTPGLVEGLLAPQKQFEGTFRAVAVAGVVENDAIRLFEPARTEVIRALANSNQDYWFMPYYG